MKMLKFLVIGLLSVGVMQGFDPFGPKKTADSQLEVILIPRETEEADKERKKAAASDSQGHASTTQDKNEALVDACRNGELEQVKELVLQGADVNGRIDYCTPLREVIFYANPIWQKKQDSRVEIAKFLLDHGANEDNDLLFNATQCKEVLPIAELLIARKADLEYRNKFTGRTVLAQAVNEMRPEIAQFLLTAGADITATTKCEASCCRIKRRHAIEELLACQLSNETRISISGKDAVELKYKSVRTFLDEHRKTIFMQLMEGLPCFSKDVVGIVAAYAVGVPSVERRKTEKEEKEEARLSRLCQMSKDAGLD